MIDDSEMQRALFYETPEGAAAKERILGLVTDIMPQLYALGPVGQVYRTTGCTVFHIPVVVTENRPWGPRSVGDRWSSWEPEPVDYRTLLVSMKPLGDTGIHIGWWEDRGKLCLVVNDMGSKVELWKPGEGP